MGNCFRPSGASSLGRKPNTDPVRGGALLPPFIAHSREEEGARAGMNTQLERKRFQAAHREKGEA